MPKAKPVNEYISIHDNDELNVGDIKFKVIHTPGHSPGGVCYLFNNILITGDTLFRNSIGRTTFPKGEYIVLYK